jgi:cysteine desulfurase/selenocysteine lyase
MILTSGRKLGLIKGRNAMFTSEFGLDESVIYLNHAAVAPWPRRTVEAVKAFADENAASGARNYAAWLETEQALKSQLQHLINAASVGEIALLKSTSEALSVVAYGLSWMPGDNVVITDQEFPSNRIVWESLAKFGVETRAAALDHTSAPEDAVLSRIDEHTRLISVSSVQYATGLRLDLKRLGTACRERGILFCVDAIQSLGAIDFDVQSCLADFVMADGHKWMLGPEGLALFYCRAGVMDRLELQQYGWHMIEEHGNYDRPAWRLAASARRFECGSPNMLGIHALHASLSLLLEIGLPAVEKRVMENSRHLIDFFNSSDEGFRLITPVEPHRHAGIVTFQPLREPVGELYERLRKANVICALRGGGIRFSPHFHTIRDQLDRALRLL